MCKITINEAGTIAIKISASQLKKAAFLNPALEEVDEKSGRLLRPCIPDAKAFAKEVYIALVNEDEVGNNMVHDLFDKAFDELTNSGSESILMQGDEGYKKRYAD